MCTHANDPLIQQADAYADAVEALSEVTNGAPLSTSIGHLIRTGWLVPDPEKQARDRGGSASLRSSTARS